MVERPFLERFHEISLANRFAGAWKDNRSAEEIISDIRESRTANSREFEL